MVLLSLMNGVADRAATALSQIGGWFNSYRPELYYMRGAGPKCREKHADALRRERAQR